VRRYVPWPLPLALLSLSRLTSFPFPFSTPIYAVVLRLQSPSSTPPSRPPPAQLAVLDKIDKGHGDPAWADEARRSWTGTTCGSNEGRAGGEKEAMVSTLAVSRERRRARPNQRAGQCSPAIFSLFPISTAKFQRAGQRSLPSTCPPAPLPCRSHV
jgi:hypothetical protein